jgi:hypothetical protein
LKSYRAASSARNPQRQLIKIWEWTEIFCKTWTKICCKICLLFTNKPFQLNTFCTITTLPMQHRVLYGLLHVAPYSNLRNYTELLQALQIIHNVNLSNSENGLKFAVKSGLKFAVKSACFSPTTFSVKTHCVQSQHCRCNTGFKSEQESCN